MVELLDLVTLLLASDLNFEFHLIGQAFRHIPPPLVRVQTLLRDAGRLGTSGYIASREDYIALLGSAHVVLSTAIHEFQGIAVLEAIAAGCLPVVPDALAYQDFYSCSLALCRSGRGPGYAAGHRGSALRRPIVSSTGCDLS